MNLDEMIKSYSDELMSYAKEHNSESLVLKRVPQVKTDTENNTPPEDEKESEEVVTEQSEEETSEGEMQEGDEEIEPDEIPAEEDMENFAYFRGRVFTGFGAFPVENAKVVLYKNDVLYAFLVTDKNGETIRIKIEAFPEKNSLEPLSDEQRTDYTADVYAEGFNEKKNLLVSAVGGSDIVLDVELTPESEAIS